MLIINLGGKGATMDQQPYQPGRSSSMDSPPFSSPLSKSLSDAGIQNLSSVLNNPLASSDASWTGWWSSSTSIPPPEVAPLLPNAKAASEVSRSDFQNYLSSIAESYNRFEDIRNHASKEEKYSDLDSVAGQAGEALVACLREVPSLYFKEDFALEDGPTFRAACPFTNISENLVLQEKLSQYLDIVELHLVKEIALRSNSFFEAQGELQDLNVKIVEGCNRIRELKETIRLLDENVVGCAQEIHDLNATRTNMLALQHKLRLTLYVNQALTALKLLVASADCAGALDVTDDLQHLLIGDEFAGLHCFRHLRDHVATSIDSINSILSAEFMRGSIHDVGNTDMVIVSKAKARASILTNGSSDDVTLDEEEASNFRDRLLPIIGYHVAANDATITFGTAILTVLRVHATNTGLIVAKLPSVLRIYRETLTADMKTAIKTAVAELIPILMARSLDSEFIPGERSSDADGEGLSLASKLRSLSSESFVQLLGAIFEIVRLYDAAKKLMTNGLAEAIDNLFNRKAHLVRASEVRKAVEWIMSNLEGHYAADSVAAAIAVGAAAAETVQESDAQGGSFLSLPPQNVTGIVPSSQRRASDAAGASNMSKNFRDDVIRENAEAVFAACDAAHGRWAKLLGVRAVLHPKLRLAEFLSIHNITQEFITATEKIGGRLGYSSGALQSQAKAFVEFQHDIRMAKIRAVLDQETWAEIDVPDEFQAIVSSLFQSEALIAGDLDNGEGNITSCSDGVTSNDGSLAADAVVENGQKHVMRLDTSGMPLINSVQMNSAQSADATEGIRADVAESSVQRNNNTMMERGRSASQSLLCGGVCYRMVNCGLILLKLLSEYLDLNNFLPALSVEIVQRVVEILKVFNTRTGHLVLGAGAMQVSGLRSITSKHLALASQVLSFVYAIIPEIRRILFNKVPETRTVLLLPEIDRVAQDYRAHRDEIYTKLVQIMRERLNFHLRSLPQIVENWNQPEDADPQPSQFARSLTKEVGYLQRVLSRTLHEADVQAIFRQVVIIFHSEITQQFSQLEISTPQARNRLHRDTTHILGCIRSLPSDDTGVSNRRNWGQLDEFLVQRYGSEAG